MREHFALGAVDPRDHELRQEPRQAQIADGVPVMARTLSECARSPALARAGWPRNQKQAELFDPFPRRESQELRPIEAAHHAEFDLFDGRRLSQSLELQETGESAILTCELFALQEQREPIFKIQ